jgi:restriction system protein
VVNNVFCVRSNFGQYANHFVNGGYIGIGWIKGTDLTNITSREELYPLYEQSHPKDTSRIVIGQQVGQIARFLLEIKGGDYVITPDLDTEWLHYGRVLPDPSYFYSTTEDGCPYKHRRHAKWKKEKLRRGDFSVPFQNTIRSSLTVFAISHRDEFFEAINRKDLVNGSPISTRDPYTIVLEQVLQLDDKEFEILIGHLLTALGFDGSEVTGKSGDGGVDVIGELNVSNMAKVRVVVQAKRYKLGTKISANTVRQLRQAIPSNSQGTFITTADFQKKAGEIASEIGFPRIGLINGRQLVDLLVEHWNNVPEDFQERLGLRPGLVII